MSLLDDFEQEQEQKKKQPSLLDQFEQDKGSTLLQQFEAEQPKAPPVSSINTFNIPPDQPTFQGFQDLARHAPPSDKPSIPERIVDFGKQFVDEFPTMQTSPNLVTGKRGTRALGTGELIRAFINTPVDAKIASPELTKEQIKQNTQAAGITESGQAIPTQDIENVALLGAGFAAPVMTVGENLFMRTFGPRVGYAISAAHVEG